MVFDFSRSFIFVTTQPHQLQAMQEQAKSFGEVFVLEKEEVLLEDTKHIQERSKFAQNSRIINIIATKKMASICQNALLKTIEEPKNNSIFILIVPTKSLLLPTIHSRMHNIVDKNRTTKTPINVAFNPNKIELHTLFDFAKNNKYTTQEAIQIVQHTLEQYEKINPKTLNIFTNSIKLLKLNTDPKVVLFNLLCHIRFKK